jgi:copper transporter 1
METPQRLTPTFFPQMLFTWDTTNLCIVFRQWHVTGKASLVFSLLAIVAICAGYEALREATRKYEVWLAGQSATQNSESYSSSFTTPT